MSPSLKPKAISIVVGLFLFAAGTAAGQNAALSEARRLQQLGDFNGAVRILKSHLDAQPDDGEAARLLAQTLYWLQDVAAARAAYDAALERHPEDDQLRVDYARMLAETGDPPGARRLLLPLTGDRARADAYALLGTLAYWDGDFPAAARLFEQALQLNATHADALRQLREIRLASAPWVRLSPAVWHDDQPLDRWAAAIEGGVFIGPLTPLRVRIEGAEYASGDLTRRTWLSEAEIRHYAPRARLEIELAAGVLPYRVGTDRSPRWTGRGVLGLRLPAQVTIRGRVERTPYLSTTASLDTRILADTTAGELQWNSSRGWMAQAAVLRQRYPDDNTTHVRYGWVLAPLVRSTPLDLHAGYAIGYEDSEESRFVLATPMQRFEPADPRFDTAGRYTPYYTPEEVLRHSVATALRVRASSRATLRLGGSYGVRATEDVPQLVVINGTADRVFLPREFHPWEARAALELTVPPGLTVGVNGEAGRGAFYRWATAGVQLTYRFTAWAARPTAVQR